MDDARLGILLRQLRRRVGKRQEDLALIAGVSRATVSRAERGHVADLTLATLRRLFGAADARVVLDPRWRGGEVDRLLDGEHAELVRRTVAYLRAMGWTVWTEITYSVFGERGSIDIVALRESDGVAVVIEVKTSVGSSEELQRRLDAKVRLLPGIVRERSGWRPRRVARIVVFGGGRTNRRRVHELATVLADTYPARTTAVKRWLHDPMGDLAGIWFLPEDRRRQGRHRVRATACRAPGRSTTAGQRNVILPGGDAALP